MGEAIKKEPAVDPVMDAAPTVIIAGHTYELRRLGLRDVFRVSRILGRGAGMLADSKTFSIGQIVQVLVSSMAMNEDEVLDLIASLLQVERAEVDDPARFPMPCILDIFQALARHQDLAGFIARAQALTEGLPGTTTP